MALGSLIINERCGFTDEETVEQIKENPYLQYFIGQEEYFSAAPFDASMMVHFRKRPDSEAMEEINDLIATGKIREATKKDDDRDDFAPGTQKKGKLIVDSGKNFAFNRRAESMIDGDMVLLYIGGDLTRRNDDGVAFPGELPSGPSCQRYGFHPQETGADRCQSYISGIARSADAEKYIAGQTEGHDLLGEDKVRAHIVHDSGYRRAMNAQRFGRQSPLKG